jgi:hypothetical protein
MMAHHNETYLAFLRAELPKLAEKPIPFWCRTLNSKHDSLRYCLKRVPIDPAGMIGEFGVYKGATLRMIAQRFPMAEIFGFDSFEGFPDDGRTDWQKDFSLQGVLPIVPANVSLVKGFFEDTLPGFVAENDTRYFSLLHIDCDIYSSTKTVFSLCRPMIRAGCVIVFDELLHYNGFLKNEMLAFYEFVQETGATFEWVAIRRKVMPLDQFLNPDKATWRNKGGMKAYRKHGYEQEVALRITGFKPSSG